MDKEPFAHSICQKLFQNGYTAYYAGGYVRDSLLGIVSDDIDIATNATPQTIQSLFEKTIPLGIAFGIVVVVIENHSFEIATFRKDLTYIDGRRPNEIAFCSPQEDACRRDFTINGMFYDPLKKEVIDYVHGKQDLEKKLIRAIGNPLKRFEEDRLRMVRAARFSARFKFGIEPKTWQAILEHASELLPAVSIERIYQEFQKMKMHHFAQAIELLFQTNLLQTIFPSFKTRTHQELSECLSSFEKMPSKAPTLLYLLELFPNATQEDVEELSLYLKVSNKKMQLALKCFQARNTLLKKPSKINWVHFLSLEESELIIQVITARMLDLEKKLFIKQYQEALQTLGPHIERKKNKTPLVTSAILSHHGILPGKQMGVLLNLAEEVVIENNCSDPEKAVAMMKKSTLWKQSF